MKPPVRRRDCLIDTSLPGFWSSWRLARFLHSGVPMHISGSYASIGSFLALTLLLLAALLLWFRQLQKSGALTGAGYRRGTWLVSVWFLAWGALGWCRVFDVWDSVPPPALFAMLGLFGVTLLVAFSEIGTKLVRHLSFRTLIGLQAFRLPLELLMYRALLEGLMPPQMSFVGYNYDILSGVSALLLWFWARQRPLPRSLVWAFNGLGSVLLANIVVVALVSFPNIAAFGPERVNTWVFEFPYIYLPAVMVQVALLGHLLLSRKLWSENSARNVLSAQVR